MPAERSAFSRRIEFFCWTKTYSQFSHSSCYVDRSQINSSRTYCLCYIQKDLRILFLQRAEIPVKKSTCLNSFRSKKFVFQSTYLYLQCAIGLNDGFLELFGFFFNENLMRSWYLSFIFRHGISWQLSFEIKILWK